MVQPMQPITWAELMTHIYDPPQYNPPIGGQAKHMTPDMMAGYLDNLGINKVMLETSLKITDDIYNQSIGNDAMFKDNIRTQLSASLVRPVFNKCTFSQMRSHDDNTIEVKARVVVLSLEQMEMLLNTIRLHREVIKADRSVGQSFYNPDTGRQEIKGTV